MPDLSDLSHVWQRLEAWCRAHLPEILDDLNPGATDADIAACEQVLGQALPSDLRASLRLHNGQRTERPTGLILGLPLLSLEKIIRIWQSWREIDADNEQLKEFAESIPEGAIRLDYTCPGWIPLTHDHGGNHIGVDLSPGPEGQVGQVIIFGSDEDTKRVVAPSWSAFLALVASTLEAGNFRIDGDRVLNPSDAANPDCEHYHEYLAGADSAE